jgi:uncharacterized protein (DUF3084 family)
MSEQAPTVQKAMNQKYAELCRELGSLSYQRSLLDAQISDVSAQVKALNGLVPVMQKIETDLKASLAMKGLDGAEKTETSSKVG